MMENEILLFEEIYEPIKFQMKNSKGEIFDCQTQLRTIEDELKLEKIENSIRKEKTALGVYTKLCEMITVIAGKDFNFWKTFSRDAIQATITKIMDMEKEKIKKKQAGNITG
jgi:hypothetical protein